jgi:hypothetical protein
MWGSCEVVSFGSRFCIKVIPLLLLDNRRVVGRNIVFHPVPTVASSTCTRGGVEFLDKTVLELRRSLHSLNNSSIMDKFQSRFFWGTFVLIVSAAAAHEGDLGEFLLPW